MSWFGKDTVEAVGTVVKSGLESVRYALTGDLPPEVRISLEKVELSMQELEGKMLEGQVELNKIEAQSPSFFKSAWRPAIGWIGVVGLFYQFLVHPILEWYILLKGHELTAPLLNTDGIMALVTAMLGIGGYRTYEKFKGVTR